MVGGALLERLLAGARYDKILAVGRRAPRRASPRLEAVVAGCEAMSAAAIPAEDAFCCLGTTLKDAGTPAAFRRVDFDCSLAFARRARELGASRLFLVSSVGANARSPFLYPRVKGELEAAVAALGYRAVSVFRPSLLVGRRERPRRGELVAEKILAALSPLLIGPLREQRPIEAEVVAEAIVAAAAEDAAGVVVYSPSDIRRLAGDGKLGDKAPS